MLYAPEHFSDDESGKLRPYFTNLDRPVFALTNLPEVVKGALFAALLPLRQEPAPAVPRRVRRRPRPQRRPHRRRERRPRRAEQLYDRVFLEYGDDSVAQLGGVHLACEQASNLLTKVLERGRLMAYLEQSTRYIPYDSRLGGRYRYHRDPRALRVAVRYPLRERARRAVRHLPRHATHDGRVGARPLPEGSRRLRLRLQADDQGQGLRFGARRVARGDDLERRDLRHRPGVRGAAAADARRTRCPRRTPTPR